VESAVGAPASSAATRDLLLAGSVGIAALGSAFAYITKTISGLEKHHFLYAILGIAAVVFGPSLVMGYFKLRRRDLTALLEASGWAINLRMKLTGDLGRLFTHSPSLPKGSRRERRDLVEMFAQNIGVGLIAWKRVGLIVLIGALIIGGLLGLGILQIRLKYGL
jgi:hypothetical protein